MSQAAADFLDMAHERHEAGATEYGKFKFLENDTLDMLVEELADIVNYCTYTAVKVRLLQRFLAEQAGQLEAVNDAVVSLGRLDQREN
jgi:hypothetical protein